MNLVFKDQKGGTIVLDNTKVVKPKIIGFKLSATLMNRLREAASRRNLGRIYDADKARFYRNKLNMYNASLFGPSNPTNYDATTEEGQKAINAAFNLTASNAKDLIYNVSGSAIANPTIKLLPKGRMIGGRVENLIPFKIGGGAEAIVFDNGITSVLKAGTISPKEMVKRNSIPNTIKSKFVGKVKAPGTKLSAYTLNRVKILNEETFPKYIQKLDKAMLKAGFRRVNDPNVLYRAYTNGQVVVDDVAPGNVGLDWLRRPKMIDFNLLTVPEWIDMGFHLKNGGKL